MQIKVPLRWVLPMFGIAAAVPALLVVFFANGGQFLWNQNGADIVQSAPQMLQSQVLLPRVSGEIDIGRGIPVRLKIPTIKIDALVESVGLTPEGAMDAPEGPIHVGWFNVGPSPGEKGSAVIDGHFGWKNGIPAVFDSLHKIQIGDRIYIEDAEGVTTTFVVREIRVYREYEDASDVFKSGDDRVHLNLITCGGAWSRAQQTYLDRLVVFSDKEIREDPILP